MINIKKVAQSLGIGERDLELYGNFAAKLRLDILKRLNNKKDGKYVLVSAMTPTPQGEGKTVTTIGLSMAFNRLKKSSIVTLRQPSLGPVFGLKGGGGGGGRSEIVPLEAINLHLTGDFHAVTSAHNLLASALDNSIFHGNPLNIDINTIDFPRVLDISDRALRDIEVRYGNFSRKTRFDITAASEIMAILALSKDLNDLKKRLGNIVVGFNFNKEPVFSRDLRIDGALAVLLKDAIKPNLLQTIEGTPCLVHSGPFANIAHGNSSILADEMGIKLCDWLITESGFGADMGAEKFFDIKCRTSKLIPDCVVLVASIKSLKNHSGRFSLKPGRPAPKEILKEDLELVDKGGENLIKQIENIKKFGMSVVVSINRFKSDTVRELDLARSIALKAGAKDAVVTDFWAKGSSGGLDLARSVESAVKNSKNDFKFLYNLNDPIKSKVHTIATEMYGAEDVSYSDLANNKIALFERFGWGSLPICMAKTQLSLSGDPMLKGRPRGFTLTIKDVKPDIGAGFLTPICGNISTMPGLPKEPNANNFDIDRNGVIKGLF